jgi:hypothetical protein
MATLIARGTNILSSAPPPYCAAGCGNRIWGFRYRCLITEECEEHRGDMCTGCAEAHRLTAHGIETH